MFIHSDYFDYKVKGARSENCILIDADNWLINTSNEIVGVNSRGGIATTNITEVLATNIPDDSKYVGYVKAGDIVLLTSVATRLYCSNRTFKIPVDYDGTRYTDIPMAHVIGVFQNKTLSLSSIKLLGTKILMERLSDVDNNSGFTLTTNTTKSVYKVLKVGSEVKYVKSGDVILVRDNITTDIMLESEPIQLTDEDMVLGVFTDLKELNLSTLRMLPDRIIAKDSQSIKVEGSNSLYNPNYDVDQDEDQLSEVYNTDRFKVVRSSIDSIPEDSILHVIREALEYCTFKGVRYFVTTGKHFIDAIQIGE